MSLSKKRAGELLAMFPTKHILVVGDAFIDKYIFGVINRLNPEDASAPLFNPTRTEFRSGGAGNVAHNVASLGAKATLIGVCGTHIEGADPYVTAEKEGYLARLVFDSSRRTIVKARQITEEGKLLIRTDYESGADTAYIDEAVTKSGVEVLHHLVPRADAVFVSDYAKGFIVPAVADAIQELAKQHQKPVLADIKPAHFGYFTDVTMITPNLKEAAASIGQGEALALNEIAATLVRRSGAQVFLTAGKEGIYVADKKGGVMVPQDHLMKVADASGCGDTAASCILLASLCGATSTEAAELANAAAAVTVSEVGAYAPTPAEVLRMLAS